MNILYIYYHDNCINYFIYEFANINQNKNVISNTLKFCVKLINRYSNIVHIITLRA